MAALQPHANDLMHVMNRVGVGGGGWLVCGMCGRKGARGRGGEGADVLQFHDNDLMHVMNSVGG